MPQLGKSGDNQYLCHEPGIRTAAPTRQENTHKHKHNFDMSLYTGKFSFIDNHSTATKPHRYILCPKGLSSLY